MKILLVDDHALFREGLRYVLQQLANDCEIIEAGNYHGGLRLAEQHPELDLALLDLNMSGSEGAISIKFFHQRYPHIPVVVVSGDEARATMEKVINAGAMGYVCKSSNSATMLSALQLVLSGGVFVPPQILLQPSLLPDFAQEEERKDKRSLHTNEYGLTPRQMDVLQLLALGLSNKEIADKITLAEGTVKIHVAALYQTLRVKNRMEAVQVAKKLNLISENTYG